MRLDLRECERHARPLTDRRGRGAPVRLLAVRERLVVPSETEQGRRSRAAAANRVFGVTRGVGGRNLTSVKIERLEVTALAAGALSQTVEDPGDQPGIAGRLGDRPGLAEPRREPVRVSAFIRQPREQYQGAHLDRRIVERSAQRPGAAGGVGRWRALGDRAQ